MSLHKNMVKMTVSGTPGTGTITLGSAASGSQSFATAYGANATVDVKISEGTDWEVCRDCTYTHIGTTVTRGTREESSTGSAISFTSAAVVEEVMTAGMGNDLERFITPSGYCLIQNDGSTQQSIAAGTNAKLAACLTTATSNADGWWDTTNKKYLPLKAGKYLIVMAAAFENLPTGKDMIPAIFKNGTEAVRGSRVRNSVGGASSLQAVGILEMNGTTDYAEAFLYNGDTASGLTEAYGPSIMFMARWLGP